MEGADDNQFTTVPCFNSILFGLLLFLPVNITPSACIIGYSVALWLAEPLLLVTEAVQLLLLVMLLGNYVLTNLEDLDEDETKKWKFLLLTVSGVLYSITVHFLMKIFALNNDMAYVVQILTVLILLISLLMHAQMWYSDIGVITDAAFLVMASVVLLYWACAEMPQSKEQQSPVTEQNTSTAWNKIDIQQSYLSVLYWMFRNSIDNLAECFELLRRFASLGFLCGMALRVWSISLLVNWIKSYILRQDDEDSTLDCDDDLDDDDNGTSVLLQLILPNSVVKSPLLVKLTLIIIITQTVIEHINSNTIVGISVDQASTSNVDMNDTLVNTSRIDTGNTDSVLNVILTDVYTILSCIWRRLLQICVINGLYFYRLYHSIDDMDW